MAATVGSSFLYLLGRLGGRPVLARWGGFFRLTPPLVARMERWLAAHPSAVVWSRLVPGLRVVTSFAAGALRLRWPLFLAATALSAALWATLYLSLGALLGPTALQAVTPTTLPVVAWCALLLVLLALVRMARGRSGGLRAE